MLGLYRPVSVARVSFAFPRSHRKEVRLTTGGIESSLYSHTLANEIFNLTATMVTRRRLSVTLYVYNLFVYQAIKPSFIKILKLSIIITIRRLTIYFTTIYQYLYHI